MNTATQQLQHAVDLLCRKTNPPHHAITQSIDIKGLIGKHI